MNRKIFIIHGWSYNLDKWTDFEAQIKLVGLTPVLLKVPGLTIPSDKVWDINGYVDWLHTHLQQEKKPVVVAQSNGGRIALAYTRKYPAKIGQLFLIDSAGITDKRLIRRLKLKTLYMLSKLGKPIAKVKILRKIFYKIIGAEDYNQAPPNMKQTMSNMLNALNGFDFSALDLPVTIIWGRDDTITPLRDGQKMHDLIKDSKLFVIDGARHSPHATHTQQVVDIIKQEIR